MADFSRVMIEHALAQDPTACELESTCRKLVDEGKPFVPQPPEVLAVLSAEQKIWARRKMAIREANRLYREIIEAIPKAKAQAARAEAERKKAQWIAKSKAQRL